MRLLTLKAKAKFLEKLVNSFRWFPWLLNDDAVHSLVHLFVGKWAIYTRQIMVLEAI